MKRSKSQFNNKLSNLTIFSSSTAMTRLQPCFTCSDSGLKGCFLTVIQKKVIWKRFWPLQNNKKSIKILPNSFSLKNLKLRSLIHQSQILTRDSFQVGTLSKHKIIQGTKMILLKSVKISSFNLIRITLINLTLTWNPPAKITFLKTTLNLNLNPKSPFRQQKLIKTLTKSQTNLNHQLPKILLKNSQLLN